MDIDRVINDNGVGLILHEKNIDFLSNSFYSIFVRYFWLEITNTYTYTSAAVVIKIKVLKALMD